MLGVEEPRILPGNPLYFFKGFARAVQSVTTFSPEKKAELKLRFANEKIIEGRPGMVAHRIFPPEIFAEFREVEFEKSKGVLIPALPAQWLRLSYGDWRTTMTREEYDRYKIASDPPPNRIVCRPDLHPHGNPVFQRGFGKRLGEIMRILESEDDLP